METRATYRFYDWVGRHVRSVTALALVLAIGLAVGGSFVANNNDADFDPPGELRGMLRSAVDVQSPARPCDAEAPQTACAPARLLHPLRTERRAPRLTPQRVLHFES